MNLSLRWLEAFFRRPLDASDVAHRLAMLGATVDAIEPLAPGLGDIRVALVEAVAPHPNADRLRVCTVNDGTPARRQVVCGAPNVAAGHKYPFAPIGATLPGGLKIEKRKLRGIVSEGMLCSARELGLGQDHDGLMELETAAEPGTALLDALALADERLVVDVTPNRPDLLGHKGVARELAASLGTGFRLPPIPGARADDVPNPRRVEGPSGTVGGATVRIEDPQGCRRFLAAVVRGVQVGPSPAWLRQRVEAVGMRSINNVVDATNCVMFELNQPLHAYDLDRLAGPALVARRARHGETLVTLDDVSRTLSADMMVIADQAQTVGVAGVMGAAHVEVSAQTRDLLLECAWFDPAGIRRTRRALGISSEASYRFERGVDLWNGAEAIRRCLEVILATAGGELPEPPVDVFPSPVHPPRIFLRPARVAQVLGVELPWPEIERTLVAIGATVLAKPEDGRMAVDVPGWRPDLVREIDLIEEVARIHGYDNLPTELRPYRVGTVPDAPAERIEAGIRRGLAAWGLLEASTLPMGPGGDGHVRLLNPLSAEEASLRSALLPGLVRQAEHNWRVQVRDIRLFEVGTVFEPAGPGELPRESRRVAGVISGARHPAHWTGGSPDYDLWDLKGLLEYACSLAVPGAMVQVEGGSWVAVDRQGAVLGRAGPLSADSPPWAAPLLGFEIAIDCSPRPRRRAAPLPSTPASERDVALVLPGTVTVRDVESVIRRHAGPELERLAVMDEYRGDALPAGTRSVVVRLVFRAPDRTLERADVDRAAGQILKSLESELDVHLREA